MGQSITEATIIQWHVEGSCFNGDVILEVATDKVDNEVVAPATGKLIKKLVQEEDLVLIETAVAVVKFEAANGKDSTDKEQVSSTVPSSRKTKKLKPTQPTTAPSSSSVTTFTTEGDRYISPLIEQMARIHHISYEELARIPATGAKGRLRKSDVQAYLNAGRPAQFAQPVAAAPSGFQVPDLKFDKGHGKIIEMDRMRQMIADHMVYSKHTSPHVTAYVEADLTEMVKWRNAVKGPFQENTINV